MKVPVPDDFEVGQELTCFEVQWPDTPQWVALLHGFVSAIGHGRFWDEKTGVIKDAQSIARQIYDATIPLVLCCDSGGPDDGDDDTGTAGTTGGIIESFGAILMANCSIPYGALRWNDGILEYRYCGEWYPVIGDGPIGASPPPDTEEIGELPDEFPDDPTACSKTETVTDVLFGVVDSLLDDGDLVKSPTTAIKNVHALYPAIDWGDTPLFSAYLSAVHIAALGYQNEVEDPTIQQTIKCRFAEVLTGGVEGITEDEYSTLKQVLWDYLSSRWTLVTYPTSYSEMKNIYQRTLDAIGKNDIRKISSYAVPSGDENCACPGEIAYPWEGWSTDWVVVWDLQGSQPVGSVLGSTNGISVITSDGLTVEANTTGGEIASIEKDTDVQTGVIEQLYMLLDADDDFSWGVAGLSVSPVGQGNQGSLTTRSDGLKVLALSDLDTSVSSSLYALIEGDWDDGQDPVFPVIKKVVWGGTGAPPFT